jgi:hypothetical protein
MKRPILKMLVPVSLLVLAACSEAGESGSVTTGESMAPAGEIASSTAEDVALSTREAAPSSTSDIPVTLPKMAYVFDYGFRLPGSAIAPLQQQHADMCEAQGPYTCQIISLSRSGEAEGEIVGELQLAVVADKARGFATRLAATAEAASAESFKANIQGEDLSKSIVDTEARLRTRIALRDRLMDVLQTRRGTVEELVQAERGVAQVNEEIDQARSWLEEQKGRVAYSRMTLSYESATPGGSFLNPIKGAFGAIGSIGVILAALILALAVVGPLLLGVLGIRRFNRRFGTSSVEA